MFRQPSNSTIIVYGSATQHRSTDEAVQSSIIVARHCQRCHLAEQVYMLKTAMHEGHMGGCTAAMNVPCMLYTVAHGCVACRTDVLTSEGRVYAVLNLKTSDRSVDWQPAKWEIQFKELNGKQQSATSLGIDPHQHTFIVYTSLPEEFATLNPGFVWHVSITATLPGRTYTYKDVPFCLHPDQTNIGKAAKPSKRHLIACTQVINDDLHDIPEWVAYHLVQGFQHFYVYVNSPPRQARWFLKQLVDAGVLTIIDWNFPDRYTGKFTYQMAQQNSCLLRSRGRAAWVSELCTMRYVLTGRRHPTLHCLPQTLQQSNQMPTANPRFQACLS